MENIRGHLELGGGRPYHFCGLLQSGGTCSATVWGLDMGLFSGHVEAGSEGTHGFSVSGDR